MVIGDGDGDGDDGGDITCPQVHAIRSKRKRKSSPLLSSLIRTMLMNLLSFSIFFQCIKLRSRICSARETLSKSSKQFSKPLMKRMEDSTKGIERH